MKRMLFNATQQEELRVAIVDGQKLIDIDIETAGREQHKSNIYKAVITRIEPSLEACFVNYGEDRHGFLPFKEVARAFFKEGVDVRSAAIKTALREGQEITVQIEKEERGSKGAALTTFVSLAGRYLVLMPNNPRGGGVSRRVEGEDRQELRDAMDQLDLPQGMSVIARTAGIGRSVEELQWDLNYLMQLWRAIESAGKSPGAFLIYHESSLVIRAIRDYFQPDIGEILIDTDEVYEQARQFMSHVMPDMVHRVKRYSDDVPLFSRFQIEHQIETAYSRTVPLPSGGAIVIDHTEALVSIDVNSARSTRGSDIETTAFNTNCEAAEEVARQLRLRDLGGLIVIDFIDMENARNQREIENRLKDALRFDRARVQMGKISRFGLMELSRQRLRPSLSEGSHVTCPRCNGTGHIRDTESSALQILRIIQEEAMKENSAMIHAQMPVDVAAFLLNEKRGEVLKIETRHHVRIIVIPNKHLETPHYKLERIKQDDPRLEENQASYALAELADTDLSYNKLQKEDVKPKQEAVVKGITPGQPAPAYDRPTMASSKPALEAESGDGFFGKLFGLFRTKTVTPTVATASPRDGKTKQSESRSGRNRSRNRRGGRDREDRDSARTAQRDEPAKQPKSASTEETARPAKASRPPREGKRNDRQRGDRKEKLAADDKSNELIPADTSSAITSATIVSPSDSSDELILSDVTETGAEAGEQGEEPRRRRRRGGRNRNRRDRDGSTKNEDGETINEQDSEESNEFAQSQAVEQSLAIAPVHIEPAVTEVLPTIVSGADEVQTLETIQETDAPFCWTTPDLPESLSPQPEADEAVISNAPVIANETVAESMLETASEAVQSPASNIEPVSPKPVVAPASLPSPESMKDLLASAGLTLAATDPEKLRAAQEATQAAEAAIRLGRARKPQQSLPSEPLIQVDTRQN
jgi:ribonuclease E